MFFSFVQMFHSATYPLHSQVGYPSILYLDPVKYSSASPHRSQVRYLSILTATQLGYSSIEMLLLQIKRCVQL